MPRTPGSLRARLAAARAQHRERHRPSGFGLALADSIGYLEPRYALAYRSRRPVAAVVMQIVTVAGTRFMKPPAPAPSRGEARSARALLRRAGAAVRERVLVCGNFLSCGFHAVAFEPGEDPAAIWSAVAEAMYRVRCAERLAGQSDFALVKDLRFRLLNCGLQTGASCLQCRRMTTKTRIVRIGNSRGIRVPKILLDQAQVPDDVELHAEPGRLVVPATRRRRSGWADAARAMSERRHDGLLDEPTATCFDREEWQWR